MRRVGTTYMVGKWWIRPRTWKNRRRHWWTASSLQTTGGDAYMAASCLVKKDRALYSAVMMPTPPACPWGGASERVQNMMEEDGSPTRRRLIIRRKTDGGLPRSSKVRPEGDLVKKRRRGEGEEGDGQISATSALPLHTYTITHALRTLKGFCALLPITRFARKPLPTRLPSMTASASNEEALPSLWKKEVGSEWHSSGRMTVYQTNISFLPVCETMKATKKPVGWKALPFRPAETHCTPCTAHKRSALPDAAFRGVSSNHRAHCRWASCGIATFPITYIHSADGSGDVPVFYRTPHSWLATRRRTIIFARLALSEGEGERDAICEVVFDMWRGRMKEGGHQEERRRKG